MKNKGLVMNGVKFLLLSYGCTAVLLLILALMLYVLGLSEKVVTIAITAIYVLSTFAGGFCAGKRMQNRKFLWGLLIGVLYFAGLVIVSALTQQPAESMGRSFLSTMFLCAAGGMLGGMLG